MKRPVEIKRKSGVQEMKNLKRNKTMIGKRMNTKIKKQILNVRQLNIIFGISEER